MRDIAKLNWIRAVGPSKYEMVLDHHMLSGWRMCQSYFELLHVEGRRPKASHGWAISFGILLHKVIQNIYEWRSENSFSLEKLTNEAYHLWDEHKMDRFKEHRTSKSLGGKVGFMSLCHQYAQFYNQDSERLRIIGTEIAFGSNHEVPLGSIKVGDIEIACYLSGRIDFLADDGVKIGPVDHKTRAAFGMVDLGATYNPHEGMTGYIYATREFVKKHYPELAAKRQINTAWMNFIQVNHEPELQKRFKRVLIMRTDFQLEQFRLRQLAAFESLFQYLAEERLATWNTEMCAHWYGGECIYRPVHRQPDLQSQLVVLENDYDQGKYWNPEATETEEPEDNGNGGARKTTTEESLDSTTKNVPRDYSANPTAVSQQSV